MHMDIHYWIQHYGYIGIAFILLLEMIGIPFPGETILIVSGIAWVTGELSLLPLLLFATLGNIAGCSLAYLLGRVFGRKLLLDYGRFVRLTPEKLEKAEHKFQKYQIAIVLFAKFLAGIRVLASYLAGVNRMSFLTFSLYNTAGSILWVTVFVVFGKYIEFAWMKYHSLLHQFFRG
ncbi:DedA family protein [Brevibacillus ruminantium]|uniref:DedA family protein n=1 Tax=Brevibacillus ruminantium TaxID=2950604 RepID=A0ABY4WME7_9BACL|nr:DedA family protein [Brevibacillus ruminantium]USG68223.1 DedA family protein [Brevibacillus ruminantium]